jgi:hypothetical protein
MSENGLGLFAGQDRPSVEWGWQHYEEAVRYNTGIQLQETVKANENFYIGKQWEGVQANGLPTPQFNVLKRVTGFVVASIVSDSIKINATPLASYPQEDRLIDPVRIINEEFETLSEQNKLPPMTKGFARDSAVRGDGCIYTFWDERVDAGPNGKGAIRSEILENTRVFFGNPNDRRVQNQPWIMFEKREIVRNARRRARKNGAQDWEQIMPDDANDEFMDSQKKTKDKVTCVMLFWRDDDTDEIWACEFAQNVMIKQPWNLNIRLYPFVWLNWDYVADCYHGQAMLTGLIPNQIFINKAWAMSMLSLMRSAWPKIVYDKTKVSHWDNRVGGAIGVAGNVDGVARNLDPPQVSPQVFQFISAAVDQTQESLGATEAALGEGKAYNTSAILSLQKASSTPQEMTKQNLYAQIEDLARIWLEFMVNYYGERTVDMVPTDEMRALFEQQNALSAELGLPTQEIPPTVPVKFDFSTMRDHPFSVKIDVGSSSYYSEMSSLTTLDNLLLNDRITTVQYLENIPDGSVAGRRKLIEELKQKEEEEKQAAMMQMQMASMPPAGGSGEMAAQNDMGEGGAPNTREVAETGQREEQRSTGFKELQKALRRIA